MSAFPGSPCLLKGAIIGVHPLNLLASVVAFKNNPDTKTPRLESQPVSDKPERLDSFSLARTPNGSSALNIEIVTAKHLRSNPSEEIKLSSKISKSA